MEGDVLAKIIQTEREIQMKIETAEKRCRERVETLRNEADARIAQEEALIQEQCRQSLVETEALAQGKAAVLLETEARKAERLWDITDEALMKLIMKHLIGILPGERHDRAHVQS